MAWKIVAINNKIHSVHLKNELGKSLHLVIPVEHTKNHHAKNAYIKSVTDLEDSKPVQIPSVPVQVILGQFKHPWIAAILCVGGVLLFLASLWALK